MKIIPLFNYTGVFAENKDIARDIRLKEILPVLETGQAIIIDFDKVEGATQSFVHAMISDLLRTYGSEVLEKIKFKSCNETIRGIISIVTDYMQESS